VAEDRVFSVIGSIVIQRFISETFVMSLYSCLGGVMISVLATGPKVRGLKPSLGDEFSGR
jgi:hypothetical protein